MQFLFSKIFHVFIPNKLRPFTHGGFPPYGRGTSAGGQSVNGGTHEGDIDLVGRLTLIDYIIN